MRWGENMKADVSSGELLEISNKITGGILKRGAYKSWEWHFLVPILIINDLFFYILAFRFAYWIRYESNWPITQFWFRPAIDYSQLRLLTIPVFIAIFTLVGLYHRKNLLGGTREYSLVFSATTISMFINICVGFLFPDDMVLARGWVVLTWLLSSLLISSGRFLIRRIIYRLRYSGLFQNPTIIVGSNTEASLVTEQLLNAKTGGLKVVGYIECGNCSSDIPKDLTCFGQISDLDDAIDRYRIPVVILISSALSREQVVDIFRKFGTSKNIDLRMSTGLYEIITTGLQVKEDGMVPLVVINNVRLTGTDQIFKLILDYCLAITTAILLMPFFLIIAILIKLDSHGPVIHFRRVMGVNGKQFNAYKFRTMYTNGDQILSDHPELIEEYQNAFKIKDDPRVTRLGKILRKTSIDELPQIFNILKNQMSVVGPRMICPDELEKYNQWDINLLTVKPGLTGLSQIRGRANLSYEKRVQFDMYYIRNWTIWMDLQIILQTIPAVLLRRGAY
jgi:exopolysaccharide biosynthesis polyprenyl glycosylphosphotransferase